jgi:adenosylcobinamide-GDP ribazoletransferase
VLKKLFSSPPVVALNILTVIPVSPLSLPAKKVLPRSVAFFPLIGWLIGSLALALAYILDKLLAEQIVNVFILVFFVLITGSLHLDGLADTVDGLFGGRTPKERLAIMKKSDIGSFGSVALALTLILKLTFLEILTGSSRYLTLLAAPVLSRWTVVMLAVLFKPARRQGFGRQIIGQVYFSELALATTFLLPLALIFAFWFPWALLLFLLPLFSYLLALYLQRQFSGLTGDHLGFSLEVQETLCWLMIGLVL